MSYKNLQELREREHRPGVAFGLFLIVLGIGLLIATNDVFHLGGFSRYFTWETAMIFVGILLLLNLRFIGGILLIAWGIWFMHEDMHENLNLFTPEFFRIYYWPAVVGLIGLSFIVYSLFKRRK